MYGAGCRNTITARQIRRRRSVFQQRVEHSIWAAWYRKHSVENYYRGCRRLHANRAYALVASGDWQPLGFAIDRVGGDAHSSAAAIARSEPVDTSNGSSCCSCGERITQRFKVMFRTGSGSTGNCPRINADMTDLNNKNLTIYDSRFTIHRSQLKAEVAELADAHG